MSEIFQRLNLFEIPLDKVNLIEASAGTGKTYTLAGLYLRLVLEAGHPVSRILVVTYTKAATEELRRRIRERLVQMREAVSASGDDFCRQLLESCGRLSLGQAFLLRRLDNALRGLDEAAIFTIHGFCQRVLADSAFESGMLCEADLLTDQTGLLEEIVEDFWRQEFYRASPLLVNYLLEQGYSPKTLLKEISPYIGRPYLKILGPDEPPDFTAAERAFGKAYHRVRGLWGHAQQEVMDLLINNPGLNGNEYRKTSIPNWGRLMAEYLAAETPNPNLFGAFEKFTARRLAGSVKQGKAPPRHDFFTVCDELHQAHSALAGHYQWYLRQRRVRLLEFCNEELRLRKRRRRLQSYDDLLLNLQRGLAGERGAALAEAVRSRYSAVLVDEFQDTDPVQYDIFRRIFADAGRPVFLVGDPKQAIYSFRGADVFTYLAARRDAARRYTLEVNWRSDPRLIEGLNALIGRGPQPFLSEAIPFQPAVAAELAPQPLLIEGRVSAPLQLWLITGEASAKPLSKTEAGRLAARATAAEIARLLNLAAAGEIRIGERYLEGGDIAVLVRTHHQGRLVREQLLRLGVPNVQQAQDDVFASREAQQLEWLLIALAQPWREHCVRAALATEMLGLNSEELYRLGEDEQSWEEYLEAFYEYHEAWRQQGFIAMFRRLLAKEGVFQRLLSFNDGERRLTNLLHLAELLQAKASRSGSGMDGLIQWFSEQRQSLADENEDRQLRLESDEPLVRIVTVHKSKGLEYPVVFCPFLWEGRLRAGHSQSFSFHSPADPSLALLDMGSQAQEAHRFQALREEIAENLRLFYVALTRARQLCYGLWGKVNEADNSPPAWLLREPSAAGGSASEEEKPGDYNWQAALELLQQVAANAPAAICISPMPRDPGQSYRPSARPGHPLKARQFNRTVDGWQLSSFTALTAGRRIQGSDYSLSASPPGTLGNNDLIESAAPLAFPRGVQAGNCLHAVFERLDFSESDRATLEAVIAEALQEFGFSNDWVDAVAEMVERVLATPLDEDGLRLRSITADRRLNELEFYYPLAGLSGDGLRQLLQAQGFAGGLFQPQLDDLLDFGGVRGYMKGLIDLVFEAGGRFYLVDYKSNWLGERPQAYGAEALKQVMARESYYLQYLIYTVALHRYLGARLSDYNYERHFGAVYYLFLRGMEPASGLASGIYRDRPERALVEALNAYIGSSGPGG